MKMIKTTLCALLIGAASFSATATEQLPLARHTAADHGYMQHDGAQVKGSLGAISWGVGLRFGEGFVNSAGHAHKFRVTGLSVLSAGASAGTFHGHVENLKNMEDLEGCFTFTELGVAYGVGGNVQKWTNEKGVSLLIHSAVVGAEARIGPGRLHLKLVDVPQ